LTSIFLLDYKLTSVFLYFVIFHFKKISNEINTH